MGFFNRLFKIRPQGTDSAESAWASEDNASELVLDEEYASTLMTEIDIDTAITAHEALRGRLQRMLDGAPDPALQPDMLCREDQCFLGRWLQGDGRDALGRLPAFDMLVARHRYFHVQAAAVLAHLRAGEPDKAQRTLQGSYRQSSTQVVVLLKELKRGMAR